MAVDWAVTGTALSGIGSVLSAGAVIWAANKAANTFDDWKQRRAAEREEEHAKECLVAVYQVADAFQAVRSPFLHGFELDRAREKLQEDARWQDLTAAQRDRHCHGQVLFDRLARHDERFDRLVWCIPLGRAIFGEELETALRALGGLHWILTVEIQSFIHDLGHDAEFDRKVRNNLNDNRCEGDGAISKAIRDSVSTVEARLLPVLRPERRQ